MSGTQDAQPSISDLVDLSGRTAFVTGGAMGIGLGIARRLHEAGANVVVADVAEARATVADELNQLRPGSAHGQLVDVSNEAQVRAGIQAAVATFGGLDIVVNNAGIFPTVPLSGLDLDTFRRVLDVNLVGLYLVTKAASEVMIERGQGGRIVNITSIDALHPSMIGLSHYDASKHGAWGFTKNVALELAPHKIWVNAIAPGGVITPGVGDLSGDMLTAFAATIPMQRMGNPDDIARAALFLASDLASYITGEQLVVDGGKLLT